MSEEKAREIQERIALRRALDDAQREPRSACWADHLGRLDAALEDELETWVHA